MDQQFFEGLAQVNRTILPEFSDFDKYQVIDLSHKNTKIQSVLDTNSSSQEWEEYLDGLRRYSGKEVFFGGYLEHRFLYDRSANFKGEHNERRTVHLGVDLWCAAGSKIAVPLDGVIHSWNNNSGLGNYGPTIIIEHQLDKVTFYTLYGHLSLDSLKSLSKGKMIKAGEIFANLGDRSVNGDYAPHLHFQLIKDMQHFQGDYPGVCSEKDVPFYTENCPNPNIILRLE
jgi:murein DD-endopeptidase MepM/ murein hydrolase activator NlpD